MKEFFHLLSPLMAKVFLRARSVDKTLGLSHHAANSAFSRNMHSKEVKRGVLRSLVSVRLARGIVP